MTGRNVVVTGLGVVAPSGVGIEPVFASARTGRAWIAPITRFDATGYGCRVGGEVRGFDAGAFVRPKILKQTDRCTHLGIAACTLALTDAALPQESLDPDETGLVFANLLGGMEFAEPELYAQAYVATDRVSAYQAIAWFYAATQGQWSIGTGIRGYAKTVVGDRAGGLQAVGLAAAAIRRGHCQVALAGGFEAPFTPYGYLIHESTGELSPGDDPVDAYRPFHAERRGMVLAEGAGILVLEEREHAARRGAAVYAEVVGFATAADPAADAAPECAGAAIAHCLAEALGRARVGPAAVDHVVPDAAGTVAGDAAEAAAIRMLVGEGERAPTVGAPKSMLGHALAAAGAIDAALACRMLRDQVALPTAGLDRPDPALGLHHVRGTARPRSMDVVLCCGRGRGGLTAGLVLRRPAARGDS